LPMDLIIIINTQLLNLKIYKTAKDNKWNDSDIINKLHFTQFNIMQLNILNTNINKINKLINELWELEYNMKHNNINQYLGLKFFLMK
jgi:DNA polymerase III delta subunit